MAINARLMALSLAVPAEGACKQDRKLGAISMAFTRTCLRGKRDWDGTIKLPLVPAPPYRRTQDDKLSSRGRSSDGLATGLHASIMLCRSPSHIVST